MGQSEATLERKGLLFQFFFFFYSSAGLTSAGFSIHSSRRQPPCPAVEPACGDTLMNTAIVLFSVSAGGLRVAPKTFSTIFAEGLL